MQNKNRVPARQALYKESECANILNRGTWMRTQREVVGVRREVSERDEHEAALLFLSGGSVHSDKFASANITTAAGLWKARDLEGLAVEESRIVDSSSVELSSKGRPVNTMMPDTALLLPSPPDSCVEVVWGKSHPSPLKILPRLDVYRYKYFEQPHDVFLGTASDAVMGGVLKYLMCCVKRNGHDGGRCDGLFIGDGKGFTETRFRVNETEESRSACVVSFLKEARPSFIWSVAPTSSTLSNLKLSVLGLEARLGPRRSFSVGVIFGTQNQWKEQDMFETALHTEFLKSLVGEELEEANFCSSGVRLATSFFGFEVIFHVAPLLSPDERRQYIGNDKVIIFCLEESEKPFVPRFRGQVNSVGIVCQKKVGHADGWKVALFHKDRVVGLSDCEFSGHVLQLSQLRKIVLTLAINGQQAVLSSPPFDGMIARVLQDQLSQIWTDVVEPQSHTITLSNNKHLQRSWSVGKSADRGELNGASPKLSGFSVRKKTGKGFVETPVTLSRGGEAFPGVKLFSDRNSLDDVRTASLRHSRNSLMVLASDSIFGKRLHECPPVDEAVPWFVRACVRYFMNSDFILREGIFRIPGSSSGIVRLQNTFTTSFMGAVSDEEDPDVVASCFKAFFSSLAQPVIPSLFWQDLVDITDARYFNLDDAFGLVARLPRQNVEVLSLLLEFLKKVSEFSSSNKMTAANLGMTFGHVLMRPLNNTADNVGSSMPKEVCCFLIENCTVVFQGRAVVHDAVDSASEISSTFEEASE